MELGNSDFNRLFIKNDVDKYILKIDDIKVDDENSSYSHLIKAVKENSKVLDVGCSHGYLGEYLIKHKNCEVYGIDISKNAINHIRELGYYKDVFQIDLDYHEKYQEELNKFLKLNKYFDYIIFSDVIEHLRNPFNAIFLVSNKLSNGGSLIISIPNILNMDIILNLIDGKFNYSKLGILDNTHLRFFTKRSFIEWIESINEEFENFHFDIKHIGITKYISEYTRQFKLKYPSFYDIIHSDNSDILHNIFVLTKIEKNIVPQSLIDLNKNTLYEKKLDFSGEYIENIEKENANLKTELNNIHYSFSWRITYPIRIIESLLNKLLASIKYNGIKGVVKKIFFKFFPASIIKYKYLINRNIFSILKNSLKKNKSNVIIVFPVIAWNFRWQRPQHILSGLSKLGYTIIYLSMDLQPNKNFFFSELSKDIFELQLFCNEKTNIYIDKLKDKNLDSLLICFISAIKNLNFKNINYIVHFPGWYDLILKIKEIYKGNIIFDCMDDHSGFSTNTKDAISNEEILIKNSDLVITSSLKLFDKIKLKNDNTVLVRNGTEFNHFNEIYPNNKLDHLLDSPIIGYYGAISDWFDLNIVKYCASMRPKWNFILIGSTHGADISLIKKFKNVHFLGEKPYYELPGYLYYFNVCIIPFKIIPLTLATNPVKFYEYISCGKPVVSVRLPELEPYSDYCYLADGEKDFLNKLELALKEGLNIDIVEKRINLAKQNSWDDRVEKISSMIGQLRQ